MHINTVFHAVLKDAKAVNAFTTLEWNRRKFVLFRMNSLATNALIDSAGVAEIAATEIADLTCSALLGEIAGRCLRTWIAASR